MGSALRSAFRAAALLVLATAGGRVAAEEPRPPAFEYVRDAEDFDKVARLLASRDGFDAVLVVFDAISFDPPPGGHEFSVGHAWKADLPRWMEALAAASAQRPFYAASSLSAKPVKVGDAKWEETLRADLGRTWWQEKKFDAFEPAARWMPQLLGHVPGKRKLLALVAGTLTPEQWTSRDASTPATRWRQALARVGDYFEEEAVGDAVAAKGAALWIVAPEARFGDFLPVEDLPQVPWAARPSLPYTIPELPSAGRDSAARMSKDDLDALAKKLRDDGLSESEIQRLLKRLGSMSTLEIPDYGETGRFTFGMPGWQRPWEFAGLFDTACPSGYGWWPYARAAAKCGGSYVFYPGPVSNWGDACPRDQSLLDAMAPELVPVAQFVKLRIGDDALAALLAAQRVVIDCTPWDVRTGAKGPVWCGFDAPGRRAKGWRPRQVPMDDYYAGVATDGTNDRVLKAGRALAAAAEKYDDAVAVLDKALGELRAGTLGGASRRSQANLRIAKLWFEQSAFHLQAIAAACADVEKVRAPGAKTELSMVRSPAVRFSDCLDAWDKRVVPADVESEFARALPQFIRSAQSNFLSIGSGHPFYRAKRRLDRVLANLDARLRPRAERVVAAADEVMQHDARCAWGWSTYYAGLETFQLDAYEPVKVGPRPKTPDPGNAPPPPPDPGPSTPGSGGGGSSTPK